MLVGEVKTCRKPTSGCATVTGERLEMCKVGDYRTGTIIPGQSVLMAVLHASVVMSFIGIRLEAEVEQDRTLVCVPHRFQHTYDQATSESLYDECSSMGGSLVAGCTVLFQHLQPTDDQTDWDTRSHGAYVISRPITLKRHCHPLTLIKASKSSAMETFRSLIIEAFHWNCEYLTTASG